MSTSYLSWAWIPIVVWAAFAQTVRNATQRTLVAEVGTLAATLVRFLYGLPFALIWLGLLYLLPQAPRTTPDFTVSYFAWITLGAVAQIGATAFLLAAMKERNFIIAVIYSKTEVLQIALFAAVFLHEFPTGLAVGAMVLATLGVMLLSVRSSPPLAGAAPAWLSRTALFGLACGACFGVSIVGFRGAALALPDTSFWLTGAWGVVWAQTVQTVLLGGWLAWRAPASLGAVMRAWKLSLLAGLMGALASIGWFTAFALQPAANVRTLGLVEVLFSYLVSRRLFSEKLSRSETVGLLLVTIGLVVVCAGL
ncbi:MAG: DMT family transporter [Polaromonas sp.]|nr:DMT family transporter [Polaromonas sp.]